MKHISILAGGTGITPCYMVIKAVLKDSKMRISLIYANSSIEDILLRNELIQLKE